MISPEFFSSSNIPLVTTERAKGLSRDREDLRRENQGRKRKAGRGGGSDTHGGVDSKRV